MCNVLERDFVVSCAGWHSKSQNILGGEWKSQIRATYGMGGLYVAFILFTEKFPAGTVWDALFGIMTKNKLFYYIKEEIL